MNIKFNNKRVAENIWKTLFSSNNDKRQKRNFHSNFILKGKFLLYSKRHSEVKNPEVKQKKNFPATKVKKKMLDALQKANMRVFYIKQKISLS